MMQFVKSSWSCMRLLTNVSSILKPNKAFHSSLSFNNPKSCENSYLNGVTKLFKPTNIVQSRSTFIFRSGDLLWEGVTGAPGRAKKRARGKRRVVRNKINLNLGRKIGDNELNYKWPGLNAPVFESKLLMRRTTGEKDENYNKNLIELRNKQNKKTFRRGVPPLKRGWTGGTMGGQSLGKPEPVIGQDWEGFDSRILEFKVVSRMTATKGRTGRFSALVMVGNGKGLAGIGKAKSTNLRNTLKTAKRLATQKFEYCDLRENRTLWHPDFVSGWCTKIYARPMPEGYGLVCHRLIKTMCQLVGIKDMYAKVEGSVKNYQVISRCFMALLRKQESYQDIANRLSLNVVETRSENDNYPKLLAAPSSGITRAPGLEENLEFDRLHLDGKVFWTKKYRPFYLGLPGPVKRREERYRYRNQINVERSRKVLSFLADEGHLVRKKLENEAKD